MTGDFDAATYAEADVGNSSPGRQLARLITLGALVVSSLALPALAWAGVTPTNACDGRATIEGVVYTPANDTTSNPIKVPADKEGVVIPWKGEVTFLNSNHAGEIRLKLPFGDVKVDDWSGTNTADDRDSEGTYNLDEFWDILGGVKLTGMFTLTGNHAADGGVCSGFVVVQFTGNPLGTPAGIVITVGAGLALIGMIWSAVPKKGG